MVVVVVVIAWLCDGSGDGDGCVMIVVVVMMWLCDGVVV